MPCEGKLTGNLLEGLDVQKRGVFWFDERPV
jgi:hypothetical protein